MTYPRSFLRLVVGGTLYGVERWSWGLSLQDWDDDNVQDNVPTTVPDAIVTAVRGLMESEYISGRVTTDLFKLNLIGPDGRYVNERTTVLRELTPGQSRGAGNSVDHPPQISLAVTLNTDARRGLASRGRFYLPGPSVPLDQNGQIPLATANVIRDRAVAMLDAINRAVPGYQVVIASDVGQGAFRRVESVRVGRVLDTIRSRRNKFAESYTPDAAVATV